MISTTFISKPSPSNPIKLSLKYSSKFPLQINRLLKARRTISKTDYLMIKASFLSKMVTKTQKLASFILSHKDLFMLIFSSSEKT